MRRVQYSISHVLLSPSFTGGTGGGLEPRNTGRSGRQNAATRRSARREERVTVQGPRKETATRRNVARGGGRGVFEEGLP